MNNHVNQFAQTFSLFLPIQPSCHVSVIGWTYFACWSLSFYPQVCDAHWQRLKRPDISKLFGKFTKSGLTSPWYPAFSLSVTEAAIFNGVLCVQTSGYGSNCLMMAGYQMTMSESDCSHLPALTINPLFLHQIAELACRSLAPAHHYGSQHILLPILSQP